MGLYDEPPLGEGGMDINADQRGRIIGSCVDIFYYRHLPSAQTCVSETRQGLLLGENIPIQKEDGKARDTDRYSDA